VDDQIGPQGLDRILRVAEGDQHAGDASVLGAKASVEASPTITARAGSPPAASIGGGHVAGVWLGGGGQIGADHRVEERRSGPGVCSIGHRQIGQLVGADASLAPAAFSSVRHRTTPGKGGLVGDVLQ
jgi:hypothetical protein